MRWRPPSRGDHVTTITIVGAGGFEFPLTLGADFLSFESLRDAHLVLMDIDPVTLARTEGHLRRVVEAHGLPARDHRHDRPPRGADGRRLRRRAASRSAASTPTRSTSRSRAATASTRPSATRSARAGSSAGCARCTRSRRSAADMREVCPGRAAAAVREPDGDQLLVHVRRGRSARSASATRCSTRRSSWPASSAPRTGSGRSAPPASTTSRGCSSTAIDGRDVLGRAARRRARLRPRRARLDPTTSTSGTAAAASRCAPRSWSSTGHFPTESSHHASEYLPFFRRTPTETTVVHRRPLGLPRAVPRRTARTSCSSLADELCAGAARDERGVRRRRSSTRS